MGIYIAWNFYQAGYDLNRTELRILETLRNLSVFPPPGPTIAELNSRCDSPGLPKNVYDAWCQYFVETDNTSSDGVLRDDVVTLVVEFDLASEEDKVIKAFIAEGRGRIDERKRLSSCSLDETLKLVEELLRTSGKDPDAIASQLKLRVPAPLQMTTGESAMQAMRMFSDQAQSSPAVMSPAATKNPVADFRGPALFTKPIDEPDEKLEQEAEYALLRMEVADAAKREEELLARLASRGILTEAETARLEQARRQKAEVEALLAKSSSK